MSKQEQHVLKKLAVFLTALMILGCSAGSPTLEHAKRLKEGMTPAEVIRLLGEPDKNDLHEVPMMGEVGTMEYDRGPCKIYISFANSRVQRALADKKPVCGTWKEYSE